MCVSGPSTWTQHWICSRQEEGSRSREPSMVAWSTEDLGWSRGRVSTHAQGSNPCTGAGSGAGMETSGGRIGSWHVFTGLGSRYPSQDTWVRLLWPPGDPGPGARVSGEQGCDGSHQLLEQCGIQKSLCVDEGISGFPILLVCLTFRAFLSCLHFMSEAVRKKMLSLFVTENSWVTYVTPISSSLFSKSVHLPHGS